MSPETREKIVNAIRNNLRDCHMYKESSGRYVIDFFIRGDEERAKQVLALACQISEYLSQDTSESQGHHAGAENEKQT